MRHLLIFCIFCGYHIRHQARAKVYLVETEGDNATSKPEISEFGSDYGNHDAPQPYGKPAPTPPPVTCTWGKWGPWSGGSQTCGSGTKSRNRACKCSDGSGVANKCGGGISMESKAVNKGPCVTCTWENWGPWDSSRTCGSGTKNRNRACKCSDGSTGSANKCGGGSNSENRADNKAPCVTCAWDNWGPWAGNNHACGPGMKTRNRACTCTDGSRGSPNKCGGGRETQQEPDNKSPCITCKWDNWGPWSRGSQTCGSGIKSRNRACTCSDGSSGSPSKCGGGSKTQHERDNKAPCVTCTWDNWGPWSTGGHTCGYGTKNRNRACKCSDGSTGSPYKCGGSRNRESKPDNKGPCVTCAWDNWGPWSTGGHTCGSGIKTRNRGCKCSDGSTDSGNKCGGGNNQQSELDNKAPCVTCTWGKWGPWTRSSQTCGPGVKTRTRPCNCSDGSHGSANKCGGGRKNESQEDNKEPCTTPPPEIERVTAYQKPKPYRKRRRN